MSNRVVSSIVFALFTFASVASAQFDLGSVVGTVKDQAGLPMANAAVEIRSMATNVARQTATSATGEFDFVALQPGQYALTAKQPGFQGKTQTFELAVGQRLELDMPMQIGTASQSVTVTANVVTVETASSDVNNVRTGSKLSTCH